MNRAFFLACALLLSCGGKVLDEENVGSGRSGSPGSSSSSSGSVGPGVSTPPIPPTTPPYPYPVDASAPPPISNLRSGVGYVIAYANTKLTASLDLEVREGIAANFDASGFLTGYDLHDAVTPGMQRSGPWHAWGNGLFVGGNAIDYAIGKQMKIAIAETGLATANFIMRGGGSTEGDDTYGDVSADCSFGSANCKVAINLHRGGDALQFVPVATIDDRRIIAKSLYDTSMLVGAFTCSESCTKGSLTGFGLILAWGIEDPTTHAYHYGAAALPYFDPR